MAEPSRPTELERDRLAAGLRAVFGRGRGKHSGADALLELVGQRLGGFRVVAPIGEGGMGAVFEAVQENPPRSVALKVVRLGLTSASSRQRFEREIRLLAGLSHPGIAAIHEAGVATLAGGLELPFFAMELVRGRPIGEYARAAGLSLAQKLELVARVCDAVQHAHQRGVIHRDLKPDNVLVVEEPGGPGGIGLPKVLDFGVARAAAGETDTTLRTRAGQVIGTLAYMSPEQVSGEAELQDTRTDVYALGVLLYELLTGALPVDVSGCPLPEAARRIAEREPRRPSSCDPRLGGDVDTIVLKALEKDKEQRYASAGELADDLRRALGDEPILARSHSTLYRFRKAVRRHRGLSAALLALLVALIAFAVVASVQARRLERELTRSQLERGALLTRSGALEAAESLLWPLLLAEPESEEALWALRNLYHRFPCLAMRGDAEVPSVGSTTRSLLAHPDGQRLIGVTPSGQLRTYRLDTLEKQAIGPGQEYGWNNIALSREAGLLFHLGSHLDLYALDSLEHLARFEGPEFRGYGLAVLPGGRSVLLGSEDGCLRELDVDAWGLVREIPLGRSTLTSIDVAPDGRIATLDEQGVLCLLDGLDTPPVRVVRALRGPPAEEVRFSPDGCRVATAGKSLIRVWDTGTGALLNELEAPNGPLLQVEFLEDGKTLIAAGWWSLDRWDLETNRRVRLIGQQTDSFVELGPGRPWAAAHGLDLRLWRPEAILGPRDHRVPGPALVRFEHGGARFGVGDRRGGWHLGSAGGVSLERDRELPGGSVAAWSSPAAGALWVCAWDGVTRLWRAGDPHPVVEVPDCWLGTSSSLEASPDGERVAFARQDGRIELRAARDGRLLAEFATTPEQVLALGFTPDGERLIYTSRDENIYVRGLDGSTIAELESPWPPLALACHAGGRLVAVSSWVGQIAVWDVEARAIARHLPGHNAAIWDMTFRPGHPDQLATASSDGTALLWDVRTGRQLFFLGEFEGHEVSSLDFDPTGRWLALGSSDGRVRMIDLDVSLECVAGNLAHQLERLEQEGHAAPRLSNLERRLAGARRSAVSDTAIDALSAEPESDGPLAGLPVPSGDRP